MTINEMIIKTPLGDMVALADKGALLLIEFSDWKGIKKEIEKIKKAKKAPIVQGENSILLSIKKELTLYFEGKLKEFCTPIEMIGSPFQKKVWAALMQIPYGQTRSYTDVATSIGMPTAFRAAANANGVNKFGIVIPCHRVINSNGNLGGYGGGIMRKKWLLEHEKK